MQREFWRLIASGVTTVEATASWVHWYNAERLHSSDGGIPPVKYEQNYYDSPRGHDEPVAP